MRRPTFFPDCWYSSLISCRKLAAVLTISLLLPLTSHAEPMTLSGFTELVLDSKLGLSVTGRVTELHGKEGQTIKKGQPILELDQRLEQLETQRRELIWKNRAEITAVSRQLETLASHLNDTKALYQSSGSVPREEVENLELENDLAKINLKQLQIAEEREEIEYNVAREELHKRTLRAPFTGQIVELLIGVGENCEPDTPLVHFVSTGLVNFVANVELGASEKLKIGQTVELQFRTGAEAIDRDAKIIFISPVVDSASGLRTIKARFDNQDGKVVPGITGIMRFEAQ